MRFLANENVPLPSIRKLRAAHIDVYSVIENSPGISDEDVLAQAVQEDLAIWTFDRDYGELIFRRGLSAPKAVLYFRFTPITPEEPAEVMLRLLDEVGIIIEGMFTVVDRVGFRQRQLP